MNIFEQSLYEQLLLLLLLFPNKSRICLSYAYNIYKEKEKKNKNKKHGTDTSKLCALSCSFLLSWSVFF